jgi:hypothetical protein
MFTGRESTKTKQKLLALQPEIQFLYSEISFLNISGKRK